MTRLDRQGSTLDAVLASLDYPMVIVTATDAGAHAGCLVGFHTQCSIDPVRYLVCISVLNRTLDVARRSSALAVHFLLSPDAGFAELFGSETGDVVDKFSRCAWDRGPFGLPILRHTGGWIAGDVVDRLSVGDHVAMVIEPTTAGGLPGSAQLGFRAVRSVEPGHPAAGQTRRAM